MRVSLAPSGGEVGNGAARRGQKPAGGDHEREPRWEVGTEATRVVAVRRRKTAALECLLKVESGGFVDRLYVGVRETDESRVSPGRLGSGRMGLSSTEMGRTGRRGLRGIWGALLWPTDIQVLVGSERDKSGFDRRDLG